MQRKGHSPEQVLNKLRQVEVAVAGGKSVGQAVREIGVTDHTYYRWRRDYGGINLDQAKRLKKLEQENARLKRTGGPVTIWLFHLPAREYQPLGRAEATCEGIACPSGHRELKRGACQVTLGTSPRIRTLAASFRRVHDHFALRTFRMTLLFPEPISSLPFGRLTLDATDRTIK